MEQKEIWNKIAPEWNKFRVNQIEEVQEFLKDKKGDILDLGCGTGRNLQKINGTIYGIDFSEEMIKLAETNANKKQINSEFKVSSLEKLPFKDNLFDSAIYIASLHCIPTKKRRERSLKELFRVLKPNSRALITVWSKTHPKLMKHPKEATITWKHNSEELQRYYYLYDKEELKKKLENLGFRIISINETKNIVAIVEKI